MREFTRVMWTSDRARAVWAPRVQAIQRAWAQVEIDSVREGLRPAALVFESGGVDWTGTARVPVAPGRSAVVKDGAGGAAVAGAFLEAWARRADVAVGQLLGFPACCVAFFDRVWNEASQRDTTLAMVRTPAPAPEANILGRWLGVRLVPHLPCAFDCRETIAGARRLAPLWPAPELEWAAEILSWPVHYSALHGVAIVTWPVVRVVTSTDYTPGRHDIELAGTSYPAEAPRGLAHPFQPPRRAVLQLRRLGRQEAPACI